MDDLTDFVGNEQLEEFSQDLVKKDDLEQTLLPSEPVTEPGDTLIQFVEGDQDPEFQIKEQDLEKDEPTGSEDGLLDETFKNANDGNNQLQTQEKDQKTDGSTGTTGTEEGSSNNELPPFGPQIFVSKLVDLSDKDVYAFISDLHLGLALDDFDRNDQNALLSALSWLKNLSKKVRLVILGDFLEIWESITDDLRSDDLTQADRIKLVSEIVSDILTTHEVVADAMAEFIESGNSIDYIFGNHDDVISSEQAFRDVISKFIPGIQFGEDNAGKRIKDNNDFLLYAEHGHQHDKLNLDEKTPLTTTGKDRPFGRVLVEEFVVKVEALEVKGKKLFGNLDAFAPLGNYIDYYNCVLEKEGLTDEEKKEVNDKLKEYVNNFLKSVDASKLPEGASTLSARLSNVFNFLLVLAQQVFDIEVEPDVIAKAAGGQGEGPITPEVVNKIVDPDANNGKIKCVLMGHTHEGKIVDNTDKYKCVYVNTGTWMDKVNHNSDNACKPRPQSSRHLTVLVRTLAIPKDDARVGFGDTEPYAGGQFPDGQKRLASVTVKAHLFALSEEPWEQIGTAKYDVASVLVG